MTTAQDFARDADALREQEFARLAATLPLTLQTLRSLTPAFFRREVGAMFERLGYILDMDCITVDHIVITKNQRQYLVACSAPSETAPVQSHVVARLHTAITAASAQASFYVTLRTFTLDARAYAATASIELIDGEKLDELMKQSKACTVLPETYKAMCRLCGGLVQA